MGPSISKRADENLDRNWGRLKDGDVGDIITDGDVGSPGFKIKDIFEDVGRDIKIGLAVAGVIIVIILVK